MPRRLPYRYEARSVTAFIQQLAVSYVARGHYYYVTGVVPDRKDPRATDLKILSQYEIDVSRSTRCRRRGLGVASIHYLRHSRFFVLIAGEGSHRFLWEEPIIRDARKIPIVYGGYSIAYRLSTVTGRRHASVRIERNEFNALKTYFRSIACSHSEEELAKLLRSLPYEPYAPVRRQLHLLLRRINRKRQLASLDSLPMSALRLRRRQVTVFAAATQEEHAGVLGRTSNTDCRQRLLHVPRPLTQEHGTGARQ
jgi:hypothetical protein